MDCSQFRDSYSDYADGLLDEAAEIEACRHLAACPSCRRLDVALHRGVGTLRSLPPLRAHEDFEDRLQARILRECMGRREGPFPALKLFVGVAGAMAVVVAAGVAGWELSARESEEPTSENTVRAVPRRAPQARFTRDTTYGHNPFRVIPAFQDTVLSGAPARVEITVDWMVP